MPTPLSAWCPRSSSAGEGPALAVIDACYICPCRPGQVPCLCMHGYSGWQLFEVNCCSCRFRDGKLHTEPVSHSGA
jgi:hypothetical protein